MLADIKGSGEVKCNAPVVDGTSATGVTLPGSK